MANNAGETPHPPTEITPPKELVPLMQAFHVTSKKAAKSLVLEAAKAISYPAEDYLSKKEYSKEDIEVIVSLIQGIKPKDALETLYAAQVVASHMLGMRKLASSYPEDQKLGLKMLKFSSEAILQLDRKRNGAYQHITVNYNNSGPGNVLSQTIIKEDSKCL
ncbi:hypothetical protein [Estrella lausannensis]|uniref:Uncharacterized protein n=1 Tax=Estrella lausannensis TaxID=483423 RepID=A0A0H5DT95_9BACT|nr:hypothetical protein [Estrella lausannensis]CRX39583.1 Conserved hypothetical protein [Estrella lausannensis]